MSENTAICPICGRPVPPARGGHERIYCSRPCKSRALYLRRLQRAAADAAPKPKRSCAVCGADITDLPGGRSYCGTICAYIGKARRRLKNRQAAKERKEQGQPAPLNPYTIKLRSCHDCGCPTSDYHCPACLRKWRLKHGVAQDGGEDYGDCFAGMACLSDGRKGGRSQRRG